MGNRTRAFLLFLVLWSQVSFFAEAKTIICPSSLDSQDMYYCGTQVDGGNKVGCVSATNERAAIFECGKMGGKTAWDLSNPVYHLQGISSGQYICSKADKKENICSSKKFNWNSKARECDFSTPIDTQLAHKEACKESDSAQVNKPEPIKLCDVKTATWYEGDSPENSACQCPEGYLLRGTVKAECTRDIVDSKPATAGAQTQAVVDCTNEFENKIKACKDESELAKKNCDQNNANNKEVDSAKKFVGSIANAFIKKANGSGAKDQCTAASLLSSGTYNILNALKEKCDTNMEACKSKCSELQGGVIAACLNKSEQPNGNNKTSYSEDQNFLYDADKRLTPDLSSASKLCKADAAKEQDLLKDSLMAMDNAARSGAQCACQLSSTQQDCMNIVGPAECDGPNSPPSCSRLDSLGCALGTAEYTTLRCQCMRDPTLTMCKAEPGKVPFAFAGDLKAINSGNLGGGIGGGSGGTGDMDLGGYNQASDAQKGDTSAQGSAPGFGSVSGGPGGGAGGGSGGGDSAGAAAAAEGEPGEKNLGLFGMAKSAMSNLLGKVGSATGKDARNKNVNGMPDTEKWRPRGLASTGCKSSQIRCKNETIWDIMNTRYGSNENSFILKP